MDNMAAAPGGKRLHVPRGRGHFYFLSNKCADKKRCCHQLCEKRGVLSYKVQSKDVFNELFSKAPFQKGDEV